jgi:hypothetical protein
VDAYVAMTEAHQRGDHRQMRLMSGSLLRDDFVQVRCLHCPPAVPAAPSQGDRDHQPPRAALPRRAPAYEDHPHAFGDWPALKLMYAAVIRAADRWRGLTVGEFEQRQLRAIREELGRAHADRVRPAVRPTASASTVELSSKVRT